MITGNGKEQKMIAKKSGKIEDNLVEIIIFAVITYFVIVFIIKYSQISKPVPTWSKSLNSVERAINNLDEDNLELTRTANVQLKGYVIKGFAPSSICLDEESSCICACKTPECSNAQSEKKYCRDVLFQPRDDFIIAPDEEDVSRTYTLKLEKVGDSKEVIISSIVS